MRMREKNPQSRGGMADTALWADPGGKNGKPRGGSSARGRAAAEAKGGLCLQRDNHPENAGQLHPADRSGEPRSPGRDSGAAPGEDGAARQPRPEPILVVEDNLVNQKVLATLLRKRGYEVDVANDGAQAIQCVAEKRYGLIFMDLQMPVLDGLEAARLIRSLRGWPQPPIIAVTAYTLNGEMELCFKAGMNGYLSKPLDSGALFDCVERCLRIA